MKAQGRPLGIPALGPGAYLLDALFQAGPTQATGMGDAPLDWANIAAFAGFTGAIAEPWEGKALKDMSAAYLHGRNAGADGLSIEPRLWEAD